MSGRPDVPEPIKRRLRQEAGFGCCRCGRPLYDYHHIVEYADEAHFRPEDMMVLCPWCHRLATNGMLDEDEQRQHKAHPCNIARGWVEGALAIKQRAMAVAMGSTQFVGDGTFIRVDGQPLLSLSVSADGRLELSVALYDSDNNLLGLVERNEWIAGDPYPWDLEYGGRWLLIRRKKHEVSLIIDARSKVVSVQGNLWFSKQRFAIRERAIEFKGTALQPSHSAIRNSSFANLCFVGAGLAATSAPPSLAVVPDPRFKQAMIVSWPDVDERVQKGVEAWATLSRHSTTPP